MLVTHGPPVGYGDSGHGIKHAGCVDLLHAVQQRVRPLAHVYGHIHAGRGAYGDQFGIKYINAATCDEGYFPTQLPIVFDVTTAQLSSFEGRFESKAGAGPPPLGLSAPDAGACSPLDMV